MNKERAGELIILSEAFLWGLFPVITVLSFSGLPPLISLSISSVLSGVFFASLLTIRGIWEDVYNISALADTLLATAILGVVYYTLYFTALTHTSAGNASLIALTETFFSYLFFHVFRKESIPTVHILGAFFMLLGAAIVLYPNVTEFHAGDLLVLIAAAIAPFGNFFQRRARKSVSSESILFTRSLVSAIAVLFLSYFFREHPFLVLSSLSLHTLLLLSINGIFLLGISKVLWIEGIHRIAVTKANALGSVSPLLTLLFAYILLGTVPTHYQWISFIPMFIGIMLLGSKPKNT